MSLLGLFDIGRSGIYANQLALRVASNNIANVNTPGYSRQDVIMQIANPVNVQGNWIGRGVGDVETRRHFDSFTFNQIIGQSTSYGRSYALNNSLSNIEQILNEAKEFGLLNSMEEYFNAWQNVATNPGEPAPRSELLVKAQAFINTAQQIENDIQSSLKFINDEIKGVIDQINVLTENIAVVNGKVMEVEAGGVEDANIFRDQRERMMKELAALIDYDWHEDKDGSITIVAGRKAIVAGVESYNMSTSINLEGNRDVYNETVEVTDFVTGGELGGFIDVRSDIEDNALHDLRLLVASVVQETNWLHESRAGAITSDYDGNAGVNFFDDLILYTRDDTSGGVSAANLTLVGTGFSSDDPSVVALDEYNITMVDNAGTLEYRVTNHATGTVVTQAPYVSGATITMNGLQVAITGSGAAAPVAGDTWFVSPIQNAIDNFSMNITDGTQVAASTSAAMLRGDNTNAQNIIDMYSNSVGNINNDTFVDFYSEIVTKAGSLSQAASDSLEFDSNLLFELNNRREATSGVSLDEEAANLIRYQRAYEAGARIIKLTDELLEMIINI